MSSSAEDQGLTSGTASGTGLTGGAPLAGQASLARDGGKSDSPAPPLSERGPQGPGGNKKSQQGPAGEGTGHTAGESGLVAETGWGDSSPREGGDLPTDVQVRYALESGPHHSSWMVECGQTTAGQLGLEPGPYTLIQVGVEDTGRVKAAERLCALPAQENLLTVLAVTAGRSEQVWCQPAQAGTLADYCAARGQLPLAEASLVASGLTRALAYLHTQELSYTALDASQLAFTVEGELKLLPPDRDMRGETEARQARSRAEDTAACAAILWLCLTGQEAAAQRFRKPLHLSVPEASEALAKTLEDAIDSRSQQPTLTEIGALFELARDPQPLELYRSAHQSVVPLLPALRPTRAPEPEPEKRWGKRPQVIGRVPDLSAHRLARGKKAGQGLLAGGKKLSLPLALGCLLVTLGLGGYQLVGQGGEAQSGEGQVSSSAVASAGPGEQGEDSGGEGPQAQGVDASQALVGQGSQQPLDADGAETTQGEEPQELKSGELDEAELAQELAHLVELRSRALAQQDTLAISSYALPDSELARADEALLAQAGAASLAGTETLLQSLERVDQGEEGELRALVVVRARGYKPQASDGDLAAQGITRLADGSLDQRVELTLKESGQGLRLVRAQPLGQQGRS